MVHETPLYIKEWFPRMQLAFALVGMNLIPRHAGSQSSARDEERSSTVAIFKICLEYPNVKYKTFPSHGPQLWARASSALPLLERRGHFALRPLRGRYSSLRL